MWAFRFSHQRTAQQRTRRRRFGCNVNATVSYRSLVDVILRGVVMWRGQCREALELDSTCCNSSEIYLSLLARGLLADLE